MKLTRWLRIQFDKLSGHRRFHVVYDEDGARTMPMDYFMARDYAHIHGGGWVIHTQSGSRVVHMEAMPRGGVS